MSTAGPRHGPGDGAVEARWMQELLLQGLAGKTNTIHLALTRVESMSYTKGAKGAA